MKTYTKVWPQKRKRIPMTIDSPEPSSVAAKSIKRNKPSAKKAPCPNCDK